MDDELEAELAAVEDDAASAEDVESSDCIPQPTPPASAGSAAAVEVFSTAAVIGRER